MRAKYFTQLLLTFIFTGIYLITISAQSPELLWQRAIGSSNDDIGNKLLSTSDGGFIVLGSGRGADFDIPVVYSTNYDIFLSKLDSTGNIMWLKSYGGTLWDTPYDIKPTSDGGFIIVGGTRSNNGDITMAYGQWDYWVIKVDMNGNLQWQKTFGGSNNDRAYSVLQTSDGGYLVLGEAGSSDGLVQGNHGASDIWLLKLDSIGNIDWQKSIGGSSTEGGFVLQSMSDGGYMIYGYSASNDGDIIGNHGDNDIWVAKINSLGTIQWQKTYGGSSSDYCINALKVNDNSYTMIGTSYSINGDITNHHGTSNYSDIWVLNIDSLGNLQWQKSFGGSNHDYGYALDKTMDNAYILVAGTSSNNGDISGNHGQEDFGIIKIDSQHNIQWQKTLGGANNDAPYAMLTNSNEEYIVLGKSDSNNGDVLGAHGGSDCWLIKLAPFALNITSTNINCFGNHTGSISLSPVGGVAPYSYNWGNTTTASTQINLAAGTYGVTVTDANDHTASTSITITEPSSALNLNSTYTLVDCFNNNNGSITLNVSGGVPTYTYLWNDGLTIPNRTGLASGNYTVTVTDQLTCTTSLQFNITQPNLLVASGNITNPNCNAFLTGAITTTTTGGTLPYVYSWSDGASTPNRTAMGVGNYVLTVTDANNCSASSSFIVTQPNFLYSSSNSSAASPGNSNGIAGVITYGGTPPYSYLWEMGDTTQRVFNVPGDTYLVTITDALGCVLIDSAIVTIYIGTEQVSDNSQFFQLYPNPTQDFFTVSFTEISLVQDAQVIIYNSLGQVLFSQAVTSDKLMIDLSEQASGLYWVQLRTRENEVLTKPVMKL